MVYLSNAFSLGMLTEEKTLVSIEEISIETLKEILQCGDFISAIGHTATAEILSSLVSLPIPTNRISIKINKSDELVVFQLLKRLEEGQVLNLEELKSIPYKLYLIKFV